MRRGTGGGTQISRGRRTGTGGGTEIQQVGGQALVGDRDPNR